MKIAVIGAGTWGIALARVLTLAGHGVTVWSAIPEEVRALSKTRQQKNLPGMIIPKETCFTDSLEEAIKGREVLIFAVPSVYVRETVRKAAAYLEDGQIIADAAKGIETETLYTMTEVIRDETKKNAPGWRPRLVALSGPTHAEEVARDLPTAIISASEDLKAAETVQELFTDTCIRAYTHPDVKGVELSGAVKNVIALAAGISAGLGFGDNTRAAIITRGLAEIERLGVKMGCEKRTFAGLAGIGDLIVTATSEHSRNNRCGRLIGSGLSPEEAVLKVGMVVEGMNVLPAVIRLSETYGVEMPISNAVYEIVYHGLDPKAAVTALMTRNKRSE